MTTTAASEEAPQAFRGFPAQLLPNPDHHNPFAHILNTIIAEYRERERRDRRERSAQQADTALAERLEPIRVELERQRHTAQMVELTSTGSTRDEASLEFKRLSELLDLLPGRRRLKRPSPPPWSVQALPSNADNPTFCIRDAENHCIAEIRGADSATGRHNEANAVLFAAAPVLLSIARDLLSLPVDFPITDQELDLRRRAQAAISAATSPITST